jgi:large subunit ribosomal protein L21
MNDFVMFAVVNFGDKQYKVVLGEAFLSERIPDKKVGELIEMKDLVLLQNENGTILEKAELDKYVVVGEILKEYREKKIFVFKKNRRKGYYKSRGHRQYKSIIMIKDIKLSEDNYKYTALIIYEKTINNLAEKLMMR